MNKYGRPPKKRELKAGTLENTIKKTFNCPGCDIKEDGYTNPCDNCINNVNNYDKDNR